MVPGHGINLLKMEGGRGKNAGKLTVTPPHDFKKINSGGTLHGHIIL